MQAQALAAQWAVPPHTLPHPPQLFLSVVVSKQPVGAPCGHAVPLEHESPHVLPEQVGVPGGVPAGQALPQLPQCDALVAVLTQAPPHSVVPPVHTQLPPTQLRFCPVHGWSQPPQCRLDVPVFQQPVGLPGEHSVPLEQLKLQLPPLHTRWPVEPAAGPGHGLPQLPQLSTLLLRFRHRLPHLVKPVLQLNPH